MKKIIYTLILCFFALNLSAQKYAYIVSDNSTLMSSAPSVTSIDGNISIQTVKYVEGNTYRYAYKLTIPFSGIETEFYFKNGKEASATITENKVYVVAFNSSNQVTINNINYTTYTINVECSTPEAFIGLQLPNNTYHTFKTSGNVRTYTFYDMFNKNGVVFAAPKAFYVNNGVFEQHESESYRTLISSPTISPNTLLHWKPSCTLDFNGTKERNRYVTTTESKFEQYADISVTKSSSASSHIDPKYFYDAIFGNITYSTTYTIAQVKNWLWISCPFDATITVKVGTTNLPLTYQGDPNQNYKHACFLLNTFDSKARAEKGTDYWAPHKSTTIKSGVGYILGIDPRQLTGTVTVTYTSINNSNANNSSYTVKLPHNASNYANCSDQHLIGTNLFYNTFNIAGPTSTNICYVIIPPAPENINSDNDYDYKVTNQNDVVTLSPFKAYFFQFAGEITIGRVNDQPAAVPAVGNIMATSENTEEQTSDLEKYIINLVGTNLEKETTILISQEAVNSNNKGLLYFTENIDGIPFANQFYSIDQDQPQSFNLRKNENQTISLGGRLQNAGEYTLSLKGINTKAQSVLLTDILNGTTTELTIDDYTFTATEGEILDGRFVITFTFAPATPTDTYVAEANQIIVYGNAQNCNISNLTIGETITIYDATGRLVYNQIAQTDNLNITLIPGTYIVRQADKWTKFNIANR